MKALNKFYYYDMEQWFKGYAVAVQEEFAEETQRNMYRFALIIKEKNEYRYMFVIEDKNIKEEWDIRNLIANNIEDYIELYEEEKKGGNKYDG